MHGLNPRCLDILTGPSWLLAHAMRYIGERMKGCSTLEVHMYFFNSTMRYRTSPPVSRSTGKSSNMFERMHILFV